MISCLDRSQKKTNMPLVSVIVPVFNGEKFLDQALASVLGQQCSACEIIVVDDGSTDGTARIVSTQKKNVLYHYQKNSGPSAARNAGLSMAQGEYVAFLDADDLWPCDRMFRLLEFLRNEPVADVVIGHSQFLRMCRTDAGNEEFVEFLHPRLYLQLGSALFRRSVFEGVGGFNSDLHFSEDIDWFLRANEHGAVIRSVDIITLFHRVHDGNMTLGKSRAELQIVKVLKSSLDRRRKREKSDSSLARPLEYLLRG